MSIVIKIENLSKQYRLGTVGTGTLGHDLNRWWQTSILKKEDPYLKIGDVNDRAVKGDSEYVWALQDINFDVSQGEVLGIIGRNGAGKSTLLKILSRTTSPTTGSVKIKGRVASLLEVGTGFHGELTGRENIFLNGAILGMTKAEIKSKLDEIIDFSGVEKYIDTPVKRYSSGMYVRLAFGVAAHLEPEILIVDEVLAVGDAEFQKKALGKMKDVSTKDGRTVLFVSHNMNSIQNLCNSCILMENGNIIKKGETNDILKMYLKAVKNHSYYAAISKNNKDVYLKSALTFSDEMIASGKIKFILKIQSRLNVKVSIDFRLINTFSIPIAFASMGTLDYKEKINLEIGENILNFDLHVLDLAIGEYYISIDITDPNIKYYDQCEECLTFEVIKVNGKSRQLQQDWNYGYFTLPLNKL